MTIRDVLNERNMSIYRLAKLSELPYATVNDIYNGKTKLKNCSAETVYRLAAALQISMEDLLASYMVKRPSFENFKSAVCHQVKEKGDVEFVIETLEKQSIRTFYDREWYPECLYLLAMLDYLCRINNVPLCDEYDDLRRCKLEKPVYPASIRAMYAVCPEKEIIHQAEMEAIPEFKRFNIIESEVRSVV